MDNGRSHIETNEGTHPFLMGRSFGALVATILFCMFAFNLLKKKKKRASTPSFISPTPTGEEGNDHYDVFLSFRGSDTRKEFADHLYHGLDKVGSLPVFVFRDDESIPIGVEFSQRIFDAIDQSKISIPIISKNYASSKWCLRELIHIMDLRKRTSHIVLPIFYKVNPSDVRRLKGSFGKAFHSHKKYFDEDDIHRGPQALEEVSYLHGWESEKVANGHEGELMKKVIENVLSKLRQDFQLDVTKHLVGIDDHVNRIMNWVDTPTTNPRMIGIYGMGGIGKTTLAKVHDQLRDLGRSIFCEGQPLEKRSGPWDDDYKGIPKVLRIYGKRYPWFHDFLGAASSGDSKFSEVRWLDWRDPVNDASLSTIDLHLPKLSVLVLWESIWGGITEESEEDSEGITEESEEDREEITEESEEDREGITENWEGWNSFKASKQLKVLRVKWCDNLRCTPDLSAFTRLKILVLSDCGGLERLHPSIGELTSLVTLDLRFCRGLKELPEEVGGLKDLEELLLDQSGITAIPSSIGSLRKLKTLSAQSCKLLREIPSSIGDLQNLQDLNLHSTAIEKLPSAIGGLKNLQSLDLVSCSSLKGAIPSEIGDLPSLKNIYLHHTPISDLPESIRNLSSLEGLFLWDCKELWSLPELPSGLKHLSFTCQRLGLPQLLRLIHLEKLKLEVRHLLEDIRELSSITLKLCFEEWDKLTSLSLSGRMHLEELSIKNCSSIERLELSQLIHLKRLRIEHCDSLVKIGGHDNLESLEVIFLYECKCLKKFMAYGCGNLVEIQGLDGAKFLEKLVLSGCKSMETLPDLRGLEKLRHLRLYDCKKLTQLKGLEMLNLIGLDISGCDSLEAIPKLSGVQVFINHKLV